MDTLDYLQKAINFKRSYGEDPFLESTLIQALEVVLEQDGQAVSLADGGNILVALAATSTPAALHWLHIRGEGAWAPTHKTPFPLTYMLSAKGVLRSGGFWGSNRKELDIYGNEDAFETLVESGLRNAMPLRQEDATQEFMSSAPNHEQIRAQASLLRHLLSLDSWRLDKELVQQLWKAFQEGHGALVFENELMGMQMADKEVISPQTPVWFSLNKTFSLAPWVDHWRAQGGCQYASEANSNIVPWLENSGEDMTAENAILFASRVKNRTSQGPSEGLSWGDLRQEFSTMKDAWNFEEGGLLLWQSLFLRSPAYLMHAIKSPPPGGLGQKSASGYGIWDVVRPQSSTTFSASAMRSLHAKIKVDTIIEFSQPWHTLGIDLARATWADHPQGWVGEPSPKQDRWAIGMLAHVCSTVSNEEKAATQTYALLMEDERRRATLGPVAQGVLGVINHLHEQGLLDPCAGSFKPLDQEVGKKWASLVLRSLPKKASKIEVDPEKMRAVLAIVQSQALHDKTPVSSPKQAPRPRRM